MSMYLELLAVSSDDIENIMANPALVWRFIAPDDTEAYVDAIQEMREGEVPVDSEDYAGATSIPEVKLDDRYRQGLNAWHAIHFLLTGSQTEGRFPAAFLLIGGTALSEVEVGYGPARVFSPAEVVQVDKCLGAVSPEELCQRFEPKQMAKAHIYPNIWMRDEASVCIAFIREEYTRLQGFVSQACQNEMGMIISIT